MANYIVTGGTGFLGQNLLPLLLERDPSAQVHVLVRRQSVAKLEQQVAALSGKDRVHPLIGDLTEPGLGLGTAKARSGVGSGSQRAKAKRRTGQLW